MRYLRIQVTSVVAVAVIALTYADIRGARAEAVTPPRTVQVTINGVRISENDLGKLVRGLYDAASKKVDMVKKEPADMPAQSPYVYYAGRNAATGRGIVWQSKVIPAKSEAKRMADQYTAAYALAALDLGYVGQPWKTLYRDAVKDDASRLAFGEEISRALDQASDIMKSTAETDAVWIRRNVTIGMPRKNVYSALRSYGLTAYNYDYAPGTPTISGNLKGCSTADEFNRLAAAWPSPGRPLPKRTGVCAVMGTKKRQRFPSADITLDSAFSIACGSAIHVSLTFGPGDLLKKLDISKPRWTCL